MELQEQINNLDQKIAELVQASNVNSAVISGLMKALGFAGVNGKNGVEIRLVMAGPHEGFVSHLMNDMQIVKDKLDKKDSTIIIPGR